MSAESPNVVTLGLLTLANLPLFLGLGLAGFGGWQGLREAARGLSDADVRRYFPPTAWESLARDLTVAGYAAVCGLLLALEYRLLF